MNNGVGDMAFAHYKLSSSRAAVIDNAIGVNPVPSRPDWASIRSYLNASCGTAFGL